MCFLGSEKYPGENEYKSYLAQHGGNSNASTSLHLTTYKFEVNAAFAEHALDLFSNFFVAPLFTQSGTSREVHAVDSENSKNLTADVRRRMQILKDIGDADHYYTKFSTGNAQTLPTDTPEQLNFVRQHLLAFHRLHYRPENLTVVVAGPQSLDELQEWVVPRFGAMRASDFAAPEQQTDAERAVVQAAKDAPPFHYAAPPQPFASPFRPDVNNYINNNPASSSWPAVLTIKPVRSMRQLVLMFPLPPVFTTPDRSPSAILSHLLGHEGPGSPFAVLQNAGWISRLSAGPRVAAPDFTLFQVSLTLTDVGETRWKQVADVIFQHCRLLAKACRDTPDELHRLWGEKVTLARLFFDQAPPGTVYSLAPSLSNSIVMHGTKKSLAAGSMLDESPETLPLQELADFLKRMVPSNCLLERCGEVAWQEMVELQQHQQQSKQQHQQYENGNSISNNIAVEKRTERWYGIEYYLSSVDPSEEQRWEGKATPFMESATEFLALPRPNRYIPRNLELCADLPDEAKAGPRIEKEIEPPVLLVDDPAIGRLWHRLDDRYALPKSALVLLIRTAAVEHTQNNTTGQWEFDSRASVHSSLLSAMFSEALAQETYDADLAGLRWQLSLSTAGIRIGCSGFSDRLADLTATILDEFLADNFLQESYFLSAKDRMLRNLRTYFESRRADSHSIYYRDFLLASVDSGIDAAVAEVEATTLESVRAHHQTLLSNEESYVDLLYTGNVSEKEAREFFAIAMRKFAADSAIAGPNCSTKAENMWVPSGRERRLEPGHSVELHFASKNKQEENGSVVITYQSPIPGFRGEGLSSDESLRSSSAIRLLCHILREPLFDELRTKQTLGYIVSSYYDIGWSSTPPSDATTCPPWTVPVDFVVISVLSRKAAPPEVMQRIEKFLMEFRASLMQMPESEIADYASALSTKLLKPIQSLSAESNQHFAKIRRFAPEILSKSNNDANAAGHATAALPWDNSKVVARTIRSLRREDLLDAWDRLMLPHTSARVVSCVYGTTFPLPALRNQLPQSTSQRTVIVDALADVQQLRQQLRVYDLSPSPAKSSNLFSRLPAVSSPVAAAAIFGASAVVAAGCWTFLGGRSKKSAK